jgi:hypothetical protein
MLTYLVDTAAYESWNGSAFVALAEDPDLSSLIPKSTVTTAQDLIVADGASSVTRLGVGTDDQVLTVVGGAVAWSDGGGGGGMTLLSSGSLASTSGVDITGIDQTYESLIIRIENYLLVSGNTRLEVNFYNSSNLLSCRWNGVNNGVAFVENASQFRIKEDFANSNFSDTKNGFFLKIDNYSASSSSQFLGSANYYDSSRAEYYVDLYGGGVNEAQPINRIEIKPAAGALVFAAGTQYYLFGVK